MKLDTVRKHALSLEAVTEEPHHNFSSFRVRGKIFVTIPPDEAFIHVFVGEEDREPALAMYPDFIERLLWGSKVLGLRVRLASARPAVVKLLVSKAYDARVLKDAGPKASKSKPKIVMAPVGTGVNGDRRAKLRAAAARVGGSLKPEFKQLGADEIMTFLRSEEAAPATARRGRR